MDYINHNTSLRTNKHLSYEERFYIEKQLQANVSKSAIAKALGRSRTTICTEIRRGTVVEIKQGKPILMYLADRGQSSYETSRKGSFNTLKAGAINLLLMVRRSTRNGECVSTKSIWGSLSTYEMSLSCTVKNSAIGN